MSNMTDVLSEAGTAYSWLANGLIPDFCGIRIAVFIFWSPVCVLFTRCWKWCLCIVHSWMPLWFSPTFIEHVHQHTIISIRTLGYINIYQCICSCFYTSDKGIWYLWNTNQIHNLPLRTLCMSDVKDNTQQPLKLYKTMFSNRINIFCLINDIRREILFKTACEEHKCTN